MIDPEDLEYTIDDEQSFFYTDDPYGLNDNDNEGD